MSSASVRGERERVVERTAVHRVGLLVFERAGGGAADIDPQPNSRIGRVVACGLERVPERAAAQMERDDAALMRDGCSARANVSRHFRPRYRGTLVVDALDVLFWDDELAIGGLERDDRVVRRHELTMQDVSVVQIDDLCRRERSNTQNQHNPGCTAHS